MTWPDATLVLGLALAAVVVYGVWANDRLERLRQVHQERGVTASEDIARTVGTALESHELALKSLRLKVEALQAARR